MKNIRKKTASIILLAIISISFFATVGVANADESDEKPGIINQGIEKIGEGIDYAEHANLASGLDDLKGIEFECIPPEARNGEYITVILEEPIAPKNEGEVGDKYFTRICYRNTFEFTIEGEPQTLKTLSNDCSDSARRLFNDYNGGPKTNKDVKVSYSCQQVEVLFSRGGTSLIEGYIGSIYRWSAGIVGIIAVLIIIGSGIQISASGGDSQAIESAKGRIIKSIGGIVILFLSGLILYTINPTFFVSSAPQDTTQTTNTTETTTP